MSRKIELLAPAGSYETMLVAIKAGANAIYLSGKQFGARSFAPNFTNEEIVKAVLYAHSHNVKIYVTINTIIYENEFDQLKLYIAFLYHNNVDAIIVQDLGVMAYVFKNYPDLDIHASTQMNIFNIEGAQILVELGVKRVILARETPIEEIKKICQLPIEVEVFTHGALCYSYSGNCLMSYAIGNRSGNRGSCAQPCRKRYSLYQDQKMIVQNKALLSMKDLMTIENLNELVRIGVSSFKIEGRMKKCEYVYTIISKYRKAIDKVCKGETYKLLKEDKDSIYVVFNRGFTKGYMFNTPNKDLVNIEQVNHQGIIIGTVIKRNNKEVTIKLKHPVHKGDGLRIVDINELGIIVPYDTNEVLEVKINNDCHVGNEVFLTTDTTITSEMKKDLISPLKDIKLDFIFFAKINEPLKLVIKGDGKIITITGNITTYQEYSLLSKDRIIEQLSKLGDSPYFVNECDCYIDDNCFFTVKDVNEIRRNAINEFDKLRQKVIRTSIPHPNDKMINTIKAENEIEVVVHTSEQLEVSKALGIKHIYIDNINCFKKQEELENIGLYLNRGSKGEITNHFKMIHNLCHFNGCHSNESENVSSPYLNIVNKEAIKAYHQLGSNKIYLSNELSFDDIKVMKLNDFSYDIGYMAYGRYDLMITKQCLIASSNGYDKKQCGSCIKHHYYIKDEYNNIIPLITSDDCQVRIINYKVIDKLNEIIKYQKVGVNKALLVFTIETKEETTNIINRAKEEYKKSLALQD